MDKPINTNQELANVVLKEIKDSGITKTALAQKVGMTRQGIDKLLQKQSFSLDDANKLLSVIHKSVSAELNE